MANPDAAFGLRPVKHYFGGTIRANEYAIEGGLAANIFTGDPVKSTGTTKRITVATAGDRMVGVFAGCQYENPQGEVIYSRYWPTGQAVKTGTTPKAFVFDDPGILFEAQMSAAFAVTDIGAAANLVFGAGNTMTGTSGVEVNSAAIGGGGEDQVKIVDYVRDGANEVGANARVLVLINDHEHSILTAGV